MYVTILMDVEDLIAPEADDIAAECANILASEGVTATLCVVGAKARLLRKRKRGERLCPIAAHDNGLHTDLHSIHPTVTEYLAPCGWRDGVARVLRRERPGVRAHRTAFGRMPSCWAGPGNTWGPQVCGAMRRLGVPAFVYAHTRVPGGGVHRFAGLLAYPNGPGLDDGRLHDDRAAEGDRERLTAALRADVERGMFWQQAFCGHPTRILHEEFWDARNFALGANPPRDAWVAPRRNSDRDLARAVENFRAAIQAIRTVPGVELRTIRDMNDLLEDVPGVPLSRDARQSVWPEIERNLRGMYGWPIVRPDLDLSRIIALTRRRLRTLETLPV